MISRVFNYRCGFEIDARPHADVIVVGIQEAPRGTPAVRAQHFEEIVIGVEAAGRIQRLCRSGQRNAVYVDAPVFSLADPAWQFALVDQLADECQARSSDISEELNVISFILARISSCVFGTCLRCSGLI